MLVVLPGSLVYISSTLFSDALQFFLACNMRMYFALNKGKCVILIEVIECHFFDL